LKYSWQADVSSTLFAGSDELFIRFYSLPVHLKEKAPIPEAPVQKEKPVTAPPTIEATTIPSPEEKLQESVIQRITKAVSDFFTNLFSFLKNSWLRFAEKIGPPQAKDKDQKYNVVLEDGTNIELTGGKALGALDRWIKEYNDCMKIIKKARLIEKGLWTQAEAEWACRKISASKAIEFLTGIYVPPSELQPEAGMTLAETLDFLELQLRRAGTAALGDALRQIRGLIQRMIPRPK
jgi:hypothetical protein